MLSHASTLAGLRAKYGHETLAIAGRPWRQGRAMIAASRPDFALQHVASKAYAEAINAVVNQQQNSAERALQQQAAPKL